MKSPGWLSLPFLGGTKEREGEGGSSGGPLNKGHNGSTNGLELELSKKETAEAMRKKKEEDILVDYNAPIHMCMLIRVRLHCMALTELCRGGCHTFPSHCGYVPI